MDKDMKLLIEQVVREQLEMLMEYSHTRKDFVNRVENLINPIIIHWVLIRFARLNQNDNYIDHWKHEIQSWAINIMRLRLKNNNNVTNRVSAIQTAFDNLDLLTDIHSIYLTIYTKCEKEGIEVNNNPLLEQAMKECQTDLPIIKNILATQDLNQLQNYIKEL